MESCSIPRSSGDSDISSASHSRAPSLPSYLIVQRQMQDVLLVQRAAVEQLVRNNIDVLNESKTSFDKVVSSRDERMRMLEKSITQDYVPKVEYDSLRMEVQENCVPKEDLDTVEKNLEQEYKHRSQTEARLQEAQGKLDAALRQVAALTKQTQEDHLIFHTTCDSLREEILELQARNQDLESRLAEKSWLCEEQKSQIAQQQVEIEALQKKQQNQTVKLKQMVLEANVEKQQEVYLNHLFSGKKNNNKNCL
ncbi:unnamed protein product [Candidula unifasciata]|uniref:Uncharacterized protein n=1 Tax=Candidula unifasciata TaxID=100452 RepID=A0A8S3Z198_9EUPU|nr:unnamed protein product [Candidula unifasciata]